MQDILHIAGAFLLIGVKKKASDRVSNLTIACQKHNQEKDYLTAEEFGFPEIQSQANKPLKDAAAVNTTRWALFERLKSIGLLIETGSGGLTKFNWTRKRAARINDCLDEFRYCKIAVAVIFVVSLLLILYLLLITNRATPEP
jgi:hypothetical protein